MNIDIGKSLSFSIQSRLSAIHDKKKRHRAGGQKGGAVSARQATSINALKKTIDLSKSLNRDLLYLDKSAINTSRTKKNYGFG